MCKHKKVCRLSQTIFVQISFSVDLYLYLCNFKNAKLIKYEIQTSTYDFDVFLLSEHFRTKD